MNRIVICKYCHKLIWIETTDPYYPTTFLEFPKGKPMSRNHLIFHRKDINSDPRNHLISLKEYFECLEKQIIF